jgi:zinc D-Ala-D-Ala dipeptidase
VEADLAKDALQLIVYDCYRPRRAVDYFVQWVRDPSDQSRKAAHYPAIDKSRLLAEGYLAVASAHSSGIAVDVGLARHADQLLELGTPFDFFGPQARSASSSISAEAKQNRLTLMTAMVRRGFRNYPGEWWHFSLSGIHRLESYDVPIRP